MASWHRAQLNIARAIAPIDSPELTYRSGHIEVMRRRREWFDAASAPYMALWWIPAGHAPTVDEAMARLEHLRAHGPTAHAFTLKQRVAAPGDDAAPAALHPERYCS